MPALPSVRLLVLLAFATGVLLLQWQAELPSPLVWLAVAIAAAAGTWGVLAWAGPSRWARGIAAALAVLAAGALGFGYAADRADTRLADALPSEWEGEDIAVVGVVDDLPQSSERGTRFAFAVERTETRGAIVPARLSLAWYAAVKKSGPADPVPEVAAGERWQLVVRLKRPHGTVNPHGFDVEAWLLENGFRATGYVRADERNRRKEAFAGRPADFVLRARATIRARILAALPEAPFAGVIVALTIGDQRSIPESQWRIFNRTGIAHLISISGLHVTVFAAIAGVLAFALARRCVRLTARIPARKIAAMMGVLFATLLRAARGIGRARDAHPADVDRRGGGARARASGHCRGDLAVGARRRARVGSVGRARRRDSGCRSAPSAFCCTRASVGCRPRSPAAAAMRLARTLRAGVRTQAVVTTALVPGTLALFQQVSLISPIANAFAIPVVTFAVVPLALCAIVVPFDAPWQMAHAVFAALMVPLDMLAATPARGVAAARATSVDRGGGACRCRARLRAAGGAGPGALGFIAFLPLYFVQPVPPAPGTFRMTVLDVGQGLAVVVETHGHALVYDTGPRYTDEADAGGRQIAPFLRAAGIKGLCRIDHHAPGQRSQRRRIDAAFERSRGSTGLVASRGPCHSRPARGRRRRHGAMRGRTGVDVGRRALHGAAAVHRVVCLPQVKSNDLSCVVRIDSNHGSALLTGDLEARGELELVRRDPAALKADVLLVPHHGSRTSSTPAFIAAVAPAIAVYTPGYRNRFGHPRPDIVARYDRAGVRSYRTDLDGALTFTFAPGTSLAPRAEREFDRRYWYDVPVREATKAIE